MRRDEPAHRGAADVRFEEEVPIVEQRADVGVLGGRGLPERRAPREQVRARSILDLAQDRAARGPVRALVEQLHVLERVGPGVGATRAAPVAELQLDDVIDLHRDVGPVIAPHRTPQAPRGERRDRACGVLGAARARGLDHDATSRRQRVERVGLPDLLFEQRANRGDRARCFVRGFDRAARDGSLPRADLVRIAAAKRRDPPQLSRARA